jgi:hypothetical protein
MMKSATTQYDLLVKLTNVEEEFVTPKKFSTGTPTI